jgi:hypothetical protein
MFTKKEPMKGTMTQDTCCGGNKDQSSNTSSNSMTKNASKTKITVKCDIGFKNTLYIRGKGANLSWDKGIPMKNIKADEWVWETESSFPNGEFKVLINDQQYESGQNHPLKPGTTMQYAPHF